MQKNHISLDRLCGGAVLERSTLALQQIARNIMDPNTDPEKARTLTLKLTFKPDESRKSIALKVDTNVKLAPPVADSTILLIGQDIKSGRIEMSEYGDRSQTVQAQGDAMPVHTETYPPGAPVPMRDFDPDTGEIYEKPRGGPIDLRMASGN